MVVKTNKEVLQLMRDRWPTSESRAALRAKYQVSESYISYLFSGSKPPAKWLLNELGLKKDVVYVPR